MKSLETNFRLIACLALALLILGFTPQASLAQTVSVSPGDLSFGVPTGTVGTPPASAPDSVTVNITCAAPCSTFTPVVFGTTTLTGPNSGDFIPAGDSCSGQTFTSAATCQVSLNFNASLAPATTLETATLTIPITSGATALPSIPLNGAYGAIKLFGPLNINPSLFSGVTWTQDPPSAGQTVRGNSVNLSCAAGVPLTAVLSSTPDGQSNVFQDNTIQFVDTVGTTSTPTTNVCTGGDTNFQGFTGFPANSTNCFQASYESAVGSYLLPPGVGQNPDLAVAGDGGLGSFVATYGVAPIDISSDLIFGNQSISVQEQDAGGDLGSASLFLATNCSPGGLVPGTSVTGNPTPTNTVSFDSNPGGNFSVTDSTAQNPPPAGTTPVYTQIAVPQQLFYQLVAGTSAAPDVCLRVASEQDPSNNNAPMCAGVLIQCWNPSHTSLSGNNCDASAGNVRDLYEALQFTSPDAPVNGYNFLQGPVGPEGQLADACSNYVGGADAACATGTGAGVVMGGDNWLCGGSNPPTPCASLEPNSSLVNDSVFNTLTSAGTPIYTEANDALTGGLAGDLSPLGILTQFEGAADGSGGGSVPLKNSVFFLVANHPLPTATATVSANGWVNSSTANVNFTANAATYSPLSNNPFPAAPFNKFVAAPVYSLTYGITPGGSLVPDTTYPVPGDVTLWNTGAAPNFGNPLCTGATNSFSPPIVTLPTQPDGLYNLHYFATDCALTEGLVFNPQETQLTDATANWASFPVTPFGIDTVAPQLTSCTAPPSAIYMGWYNANFSQSCTVTDQKYVAGVSGSGFLPLLVNSIQGGPAETFSITTNAPGGATTTGVSAVPAPATPAWGCDLAGNCVPGGVSAGPYNFDLQAPTITASAGSSTVGGLAITVTYACSDAGSGIPMGGCTISGTPANYAPIACSPSSGATVTCGGTIPTTMAESGTLTVSAKDNVGNLATHVMVNYMVSPATPTITFGPAPAPTYPGSNFTVSATTTNTDSPTVTYSVVSGPCALVSGATFSPTGAGICMVRASGAATANFTAASNTQNVTISAGTTLSVKPTSLNFGTLYLGQSGFPQFVVVTNIWSSSVVISSVTTTGGNAAGDFGDLSFCSPYFSKLPGTLPAGKSCVIGVDAINVATSNSTQVFSPTAATATLTITPSIGSAVAVPMSVLVINPQATLSASKLTFPTTTVNSTSQMSVTLTNTGNTQLNIGTLTTSGSKSFALTSGVNNCTNGEIVNARANCVIYVNFKPSSKPTVTGSVTITDNAWKSPQTISLSGAGK